MQGPKALWGPTEHLLAAAVDTLIQANWQRAGAKKKRPEPIPRPGHGVEKHRSDLTPGQMERRLVALEQRSRR